MILFSLSGHGHFDMSAYEAYLAGELEDLEFSEADMEAALERLPDAPVPAYGARRRILRRYLQPPRRGDRVA